MLKGLKRGLFVVPNGTAKMCKESKNVPKLKKKCAKGTKNVPIK